MLIFAAMVGALMFMGLSEQPETPEHMEESMESSEESSESESSAESSAESSESESSAESSAESSESDRTPESSEESTPAESSEESEPEETTESYVYYIETSPEESIDNTPESSAESSAPVSDWDYYDGGRYGDKGRLIIPNVGVSVALYQCDWFDKSHGGQTCVDNYDSAAWLVSENTPDFWSDYFDNSVIIADHTEQGFNAIKSMTCGDIAYIYNSDGTCEKYEHIKTDYNGSNVNTYLPELNYNLWKPRWSDGQYATIGHKFPEYITMYTCNDWYGSITLVLLKRMG